MDGKKGKVSFTFMNNSAEKGDWYISIYNSNGTQLGKKIRTGYNDLSTTTAEYDLEPYDTIYVGITKGIGSYSNSAVGKEYVLTTNFTEEEKIEVPASPVLSVKTRGKSNIKLNYNKPDNTTKFEFNYRKKGASNWKSKTTTKTSINLKGLKRKTKYELRVRAINTVDGTDYPGNWSTVKTAKTK